MSKLLFRASSIGNLMSEKQGSVVTANQYKEYERLTALKDAFDNGLPKSKDITPNQKETLKELTLKINSPFELGDTAKSTLQALWLEREKGIKPMLKSKYLLKGQYNEEEAISLISDVDGQYYKKNTERRDNGVITGEIDVKHNVYGKKIIIDTKCSWDAFTFMKADEDKNYEWQGDTYMELWNADEFHVKYCLLDCPPHIYEQQQRAMERQYGIIDNEMDEYSKLYQQLNTNLIYSNNPAFTKEERVKTVIYKRNPEKIEMIYDRAPHWIEYYQKITLNGVN